MNVKKIREFLCEKNFDGMLLRQSHNFSWLTNGHYNYIVRNTFKGEADILVRKESVYIFVNGTEKERIVQEELSNVPFLYEIKSCQWYENMDELILREIGEENIACDIPFYGLTVIEDALCEVRSTLGEEEINRYRELCHDTATILEEVCQGIEVGMKEHEIEGELAKQLLMQDIRAHVILIASDERIYSYRHPIPTHKRIKELVMVVVCGERYGLVANATRLVSFKELNQELREHQRQVAHISAVMMTRTKPGVAIGDVVTAGIKQYAAYGYPNDWKKLHQGGMTGYKTREFLATPEHRQVVEVNQAFAWNPMLPGVKCEDTFLVTSDGIDILTHTNNWVYEEIVIDGSIVLRPAILVKKQKINRGEKAQCENF